MERRYEVAGQTVESQQLVEAGKMVHMPMCDKVVADAQELARRKSAMVVEIEKKRARLEHEIHVKPRISEGIVDKRRIKMSWHTSDRFKLYSGSVQFANRPPVPLGNQIRTY